MESERKVININGEDEYVTLFYQNLDIETEETLIGLIIDENSIMNICPHISVNSYGKLVYDFEIHEGVFDYGITKLKEQIPLIVKKVDEHCVKDLLSGEIFNVGVSHINEINSIDCGMEYYQNCIEKFKDNTACINLIKFDEKTKKHRECFFKVDDSFKRLYYKYTLSHKDEIIFLLKKIKLYAKKEFVELYKEGINLVQEIANTENIIYDSEKQGNKLKL